jgi:hypothetical protein
MDWYSTDNRWARMVIALVRCRTKPDYRHPRNRGFPRLVGPRDIETTR